MTEPTRRRTLVPKTTIIAAAVIVGLVVLAVVAAAIVTRARLMETPDVVGLPTTNAEASLDAAGLIPKVQATRVSVTVPAGRVISQDPAAGALLAPGATVALIISAGQQTFVVPDLVGSPLDGARDVLVALGLKVIIESTASESTESVVLEMFPAPGAPLSVGDEIRLTVPGTSSSSDVLLPYDLRGASVLLDPMPAPGTGSVDAPMEVARRLQSLLEAAGAVVTTTRTGTAETASPPARTGIARASTASFLIGIDIGSSGAAGITVRHLPATVDAERSKESLGYARSITRAASLPGLVVSEPAPSNDPILAAFPGVGVRVTVGDSSVETDRLRFADPAWADQVARAIYRGIGTASTVE